ncbi:MAG TPA: four-carbon acid sugar kinase family protein [Bryobacteraceae bacterium]|nr:four-carbon acid sugar kinase family protein [Bryobacteraceae bacterium]
MEVLALADDLTGALEAGAKFAAAGVRTVVTLGGNLPAGVPVVVVDTQSRHLPAEEAAGRVFDLARAAFEAGARMVYKKTDSTLRGNIGAELGAVVRASGGTELVYAPAYPAMGRTVRQGCLYVDGVPVSETAFARDTLNPVSESSIVRVLAGQTSAPIRVWDGETDADIEAAARAAIPARMAAGPAAMAEALAALLPLERTATPGWPAMRRALVVNGSLHEASRCQVAHARANGWSSGWPWRLLAKSDRRAVRQTMQGGRPDALVVFGGDTAFGILRNMGLPAIEPIREILPGVPLSRIARGGRNLYLITKAGGFGPPDVLTRIRAIIEKGS